MTSSSSDKANVGEGAMLAVARIIAPHAEWGREPCARFRGTTRKHNWDQFYVWDTRHSSICNPDGPAVFAYPWRKIETPEASVEAAAILNAREDAWWRHQQADALAKAETILASLSPSPLVLGDQGLSPCTSVSAATPQEGRPASVEPSAVFLVWFRSPDTYEYTEWVEAAHVSLESAQAHAARLNAVMAAAMTDRPEVNCLDSTDEEWAAYGAWESRATDLVRASSPDFEGSYLNGSWRAAGFSTPLYPTPTQEEMEGLGSGNSAASVGEHPSPESGEN